MRARTSLPIVPFAAAVFAAALALGGCSQGSADGGSGALANSAAPATAKTQSAPEVEVPALPPAPEPARQPERPPERRQAQRYDPGPRIAFDAASFDFGKVSDVHPLEHAFSFTNTGDQRLVISDAKPSCGCTTATLEKKTYEPGEVGSIGASWKPMGFGQQKKTVTVTTNGRPEHTILSLHAEIVPFVAFDPIYLNFGQVQLGSEHSMSAAMSCPDPALEVLSVSANNPHVKAELVEQGGERSVVVTLLDSAPWGMLTGEVALEVRGRPEPGMEPIEHKATLGFNAQLFGEIQLDRTLFAVGRVDPGASFRSEVIVTRTNHAPFQITSALLENPTLQSMTVAIEPLPKGEGIKLVLSGESGSYLGLIRANVRMQTDVPGEQERAIPVMGIVRALDESGH